MDEPVPLQCAVATTELALRPSRTPDHAAENVALLRLLHALNAAGGAVLQDVAEDALALCGADAAGVSILETEDGHDICRWHGGAGTWKRFAGQSLPTRQTVCGAALARGIPLLAGEPEGAIGWRFDDVPPIAEVLVVPFRVDGEWVGTVWAILHRRDKTFDREDLRLLSALAEFASLAMQLHGQRRRVQVALDREVAGLRQLQAVSLGLIAENDVAAFYRRIIEAAMAIMEAPFASLQRVERTGDLKLLDWHGFHPQSAAYWDTVLIDSHTTCGDSLDSRRRTTIRDIELEGEHAGEGNLAEFRRSGIRAMQSTPLITRSGKLVGMVSTHWREPHTPGESELRLFDVLAREAADLLERTETEAALRLADRNKDEFLAVLGHELRNPLAPLSTGIEVLSRPGHAPEVVDGIHTMMRRQVAHLARLVDDLLDLSRITRGKVELKRTLLDVRFVVEAAVDLARPALDQRAHRLTIAADGVAATVDGDLDRLTQVFANLLTNAAKYMDPGGEIALRIEAGDDDVRVHVRDEGFGIPADQLESIFGMFSQVPEHRARKGGGGLGIGLALSRQLIELHDGALSVASDGPGRGSTFSVRLPRSHAAPAAAPAADTAPRLHVSRRILIVDDNVDAAGSLADALQLDGHAIAVAHDGPAALAAAAAFRPEIVILDIGLPDMDGYDVARRLRAGADTSHATLVALTGWSQEADRQRAYAAGFDAHLAKPVGLAELRAVLDPARAKSA